MRTSSLSAATRCGSIEDIFGVADLLALKTFRASESAAPSRTGVATAAPVYPPFLPARRDDDPSGSGGDAFRQADVPLAFVPVHAEDDGGVCRWMVERRLQEQEIRPKLAYRERGSIDEQAHLHIGRMAGMTGRDQDG